MILLDSNIYISALVFKGNCSNVINFIRQTDDKIVVSESLLAETRRVLNSKFPAHYILFQKFIELLMLQEKVIEIKLGEIEINICRDPKDNHILEAAVLGKAEFIITGDKDLLVLDVYNNIKIITPAQFIQSAKQK